MTLENRDERFSIPLRPSEKRMIEQAAKIVGEAPTVFAREILKRLAKQTIQRAGKVVRFDGEGFKDTIVGGPRKRGRPRKITPEPPPAQKKAIVAAPAPTSFVWPKNQDDDD